jgi:hypothetical protein
VDWQAVGTIVALVGVVGSFVMTWRGQRIERENASNTALRAEAAARLTEEYSQRVVIALEAMAQRDALPTYGVQPRRVRWSLARQTGDTYILENIGTATATAIEVSADESLPLLSVSELPEELKADEALTFMAAPTLATSDMTITVSWVTEGGATREEWRYPLPYRR